VIAEISSHAFDAFFAWAPWVIGAAIYLAFYIAKRNESVVRLAPSEPTYACAVCGRRGSRDQMIQQHHGGAIGYQCAECATTSSHATAH
jgi:hypothetical protein